MKHLTLKLLLLSGVLAVSACGERAKQGPFPLSVADQAHAADPPEPAIPAQLRPVAPGSAEEGERSYLLEAVIKPLLSWSVDETAAKIAERRRADGLVAKAKVFNETLAKRKVTIR